MIKCIKTITLVILAIGNWGFAQAQLGRNLDDHVLIKMSQESVFQAPSEKYDGSPYLDESFVNGDVYINDGKYSNVPLRYNIFMDYIEFKMNNQIYILDPDRRINKVILGNDTLVVYEYSNGSKLKPGYLKVLTNGKATLLTRLIVKYREAQPPKPMETEGKLAKYSRFPDDVFIKFDKGELVEVGNVKKLIQSFPDRQTELNAFAKKNKIGSKEEDLVKLVRYYNSL